jgi:hypothetical protein
MPIKQKRQVVTTDRRRKVAEIYRNNPYIEARDVAEILDVKTSIINNDVREINRLLNIETVEEWNLHRQRILREVSKNKTRCMTKLSKCRGATAGTRWMEEWTKLVEKECKILGIYAPDRQMVAHLDATKDFSKEQRDAAVNAVLFGSKKIIDVTPQDDDR